MTDDVPMKSFSLVHNIPSPYRLHLFRKLHELLSERDVQFHVHFMAEGHHDRPHWIAKPEDLNFPHTFWWDMGPKIKGKEWHLNPSMVLHLVRQRNDVLLVGGPWDSLTGMMCSLFARREIGVAWYESNTSNPGRITGFMATFKRFLLKNYTHYAMPGLEGVKHANMLLGERFTRGKVAFLPNLVDENRFSPGWLPTNFEARDKMRSELGIDRDSTLALWPARLIREKGIVEFLGKLSEDDFPNIQVLIIGQGPLKRQVDDVIATRHLHRKVRVMPYMEYSRMPQVYMASDLVLLPSVEDSNPLTVVEALHSGLPLLLSNRVGNFPEALEDGRNGWALDPFNEDSVRNAVHRAFVLDRQRYTEMGEHSLRKGREFWDSKLSLSRMLDSVLPRQ